MWYLQLCSFSIFFWLFGFCFGYIYILGLFVLLLWKIPLKFWGITLNLWITLNRMDIWTINSSNPWGMECLSIYLYFLCFLTLMSYSFQCISCSSPWLNSFLGIYSFDEIVNGIVFLIPLFLYNDFNFFSIIAGLQCSVSFLLCSIVTQLHIHVYL